MGALGGHFEITLGTLGWLGVTCGPLWDHFGHMMRIHAGLIGLKIEKVLPTAARSKFLKGQSGDGYSTEELQLSEPDHFGVTLGCLRGHFRYVRVTSGDFGITLKSLWSQFRYMKGRFPKTPIFPIDLNDFMQL